MEGTNNCRGTHGEICIGGGGGTHGQCQCQLCLNQLVSSENTNKSIEDLINDMEKRMGEITSGMMEIKEKQEEDFTAEGIDITDSLPTIDEALKLRKENDELKEEIEGFNNGGVFKDITQENERLKEEIEKLEKQNKTMLRNHKHALETKVLGQPPYPEPPPGAPYLWKNAMCRHTLCNMSPDECGYAHTIEEARYYQKRIQRKDVKQQGEINLLKTQALALQGAVKDLTNKIPYNHHKRLSPYDKRLLGSIFDDVCALEHEGAHDAGEVAEYELYAPKKKLLVRLLK